MNVAITLPKKLTDAILNGEKLFEMRKVMPRHLRIGEDGFFVVDKGTRNVRCWCRVDEIQTISTAFSVTRDIRKKLAVSRQYVDKYRSGAKFIYLWRIGKVIRFEDSKVTLKDLVIDRTPQSFAYCPYSYGESF